MGSANGSPEVKRKTLRHRAPRKAGFSFRGFDSKRVGVFILTGATIPKSFEKTLKKKTKFNGFIADLRRGTYKQSEYGKVILPLIEQPNWNFKFALEDLFDNKLSNRMDANQEIFERVTGDDDFGTVVKEWLLKKIYKRFNYGEAA